ncbi:arabinogalactan oligomer ABC transporter substrate-binding protein GanS [Candidatus Kapaibacterium sp.]
MNRYFLYLGIILLIFLNSCGKKGESVSDKTIKFWHFWSEPNQKGIIKSLVEEFEKENNCKVELSELSWNDGKTKLFAAFNAGNAPDVIELGSDWVAQFSSAGVLSEWTNQDIHFDKFVDFSIEPTIWNNKYYCVPWVVDTRVLFYNKSLINENGLKKIESGNISYDDVVELARLANNNNTYGWGANGSDRHRLYKKIVSMFWSFGGKILDSAGIPQLNSSANAAALDKYAELSRYGLIETQRQIDASFVEGRVALWVSGGWLLEKIKNENPKLNFAVTMVPSSTNSRGISFAGGEYLAVNSKSKNAELAKKFVKYMTDGKNSLRFCKEVIEAGFPADKSFFNDEFYQSQPNRLVFAKQLESAKMTPVHPKWLDIEAIIEDAAVTVLFGKLSPQEALNQAQSKIKELIK